MTSFSEFVGQFFRSEHSVLSDDAINQVIGRHIE